VHAEDAIAGLEMCAQCGVLQLAAGDPFDVLLRAHPTGVAAVAGYAAPGDHAPEVEALQDGKAALIELSRHTPPAKIRVNGDISPIERVPRGVMGTESAVARDLAVRVPG
jgi:hypothetical protein